MSSLGRSGHENDAARCLAVLQGHRHHIDLPPQSGPTVSGTLKGGNLTVLASLVGTPSAPISGKQDLWFFEDVQEAPYRIDRSLWQLKSSGLLDGAQGIFLGDFDLVEAEHRGIVELFREEFDIPIFEGFPAGHRGPLEIAPIGLQVTFRPKSGWLGTPEPWVSCGG